LNQEYTALALYGSSSPEVTALVSAGLPSSKLSVSFFLYKSGVLDSPKGLVAFGSGANGQSHFKVVSHTSQRIFIYHQFNLNVIDALLSYSTTVPYNENAWNHILVTYDDSPSHKLYLNGNELSLTHVDYGGRYVGDWLEEITSLEIGSLHGGTLNQLEFGSNKIANVNIYYSVLDISSISSFEYGETGAGLAIKQT
jgi:hypothetical protein